MGVKKPKGPYQPAHLCAYDNAEQLVSKFDKGDFTGEDFEFYWDAEHATVQYNDDTQSWFVYGVVSVDVAFAEMGFNTCTGQEIGTGQACEKGIDVLFYRAGILIKTENTQKNIFFTDLDEKKTREWFDKMKKKVWVS